MVSETLDTVDLDALDDEEIDALFEAEEEDEQVAQNFLKRGQEYTNTGDYVTVYHTLDGMPVEILSYMRRQTLKFRREDGKRRFSTKPLMQYKAGLLPCMLNPKHPEYHTFAEVGINITCNKANLRTATDVRRHMQRTHKDENQVYYDHLESIREQRREDQLERQLQMQQQQIEILTRLAGVQLPTEETEISTENDAAPSFDDPMFPQPKPRGRPEGSQRAI